MPLTTCPLNLTWKGQHTFTELPTSPWQWHHKRESVCELARRWRMKCCMFASVYSPGAVTTLRGNSSCLPGCDRCWDAGTCEPSCLWETGKPWGTTQLCLLCRGSLQFQTGSSQFAGYCVSTFAPIKILLIASYKHHCTLAYKCSRSCHKIIFFHPRNTALSCLIAKSCFQNTGFHLFILFYNFTPKNQIHLSSRM